MALRQPPQQQRRQTQRPISLPQSVDVGNDATHDSGAAEDAQEWILFSPAAVDDEPSLTSYDSQTQSRLSDLGSLETGGRSDQQHGSDDVTCQGTDVDVDDDEAEELDSLDDGLHAFHAPPSLDQSAAVFPAHDGLGAFPDGVQEQLWQFERYNPNRRRAQRRRSSLQRRFDALDQPDVDKHEERRLRIENWRLEQSRAVLDEIEREAKRRKRTLSVATAQTEEETESDSFWQRITRRVIKDLMGLDDSTLCVIFGEALAPEAATTPTQQSPVSSAVSTHQQSTWEHRLLSRIARELGFLAHKLAEHDGAFSTYAAQPQADVNSHRPRPASKPRDIPAPAPSLAPSNLSTAPLFAPTFANPPLSPTAEVDTSLWGIQEEPHATAQRAQTSPKDNDQEPNYWEQELDVGVVFRYLRSRFSSRPPSPSPSPAPQPSAAKPAPQPGVLPAEWASPAAPSASALGTSPESRRRADLIRRHHPLVSHAASVSASRRRESVLLRSLHRRTASSSCASQSTKRTRSGGSRRYWDFPSGASSAAGGSVVSLGSTGVEGVMGNWGEV